MTFTPHMLSALGAAGLILAGCVDADPAVSGADDAAANVAPDTPVSADVDPAAPGADATSDELRDCNGGEARRFVGEQADDATRARLLEAVAPVSAVRWVRPGDATTEDYSASRLNVMLDVGGTIVSVHCG
jgi:hypothetical protein